MLNKCVFMGRLTRDPETRYTKGTEPVAITHFSIAVDRDYKKGNEKTTDFFDVEAWRQRGEFVGKYFKKGMLVVVVGRLEPESWVDQNSGQKRSKILIAADDCYFAEGKKQTENEGNSQNTNQNNDYNYANGPAAYDQSSDQSFDPYGDDQSFDPYAA